MKIADKIYRLAVTLALFFFILKFIGLTIEKNKAYKLAKKYIDSYKDSQEQIIVKNQKRIVWLELQNQKNENLVFEQLNIIDSLQRVKSKIKVIYVEKNKKINDYNAKQLETYFKNEIK
jgi:hypothetical protein